MVVLDADSVMTGECLSGLVRLMEANPNAGIIQSPALGHGHAVCALPAVCHPVYGPLFTAVCTSGSWVPLLGTQRHYPREAVH
jgi:membrane glycosyltransferase